MIRQKRHVLASGIAVVAGLVTALTASAGDSEEERLVPKVKNPGQQSALYGYYPTQWKPYPGSWSEIRPIVATPSAPTAYPVPEQPPQNNRVFVPPRRLPVDEAQYSPPLPPALAPSVPLIPFAADSTTRTTSELPLPDGGSSVIPLPDGRGSVIPLDGPIAVNPEASGEKPMVYVASSLDNRPTPSAEPVWAPVEKAQPALPMSNQEISAPRGGDLTVAAPTSPLVQAPDELATLGVPVAAVSEKPAQPVQPTPKQKGVLNLLPPKDGQ
jgi:hypothetical protein